MKYPMNTRQGRERRRNDSLFGKRIQYIFFYYDDPIYCEKHKSLKHVVPCYKNVKTGGAK